VQINHLNWIKKDYRLNFCWDMSKMHYFSNKSSKIAKLWGLSASNTIFLWCRWPEVAWFDQIVVFQTNSDEIEFKKSVMTSFHWRHHNCSTEKRHQNNFPPIKLSGYASELQLHCFTSLKAKLCSNSEKD